MLRRSPFHATTASAGPDLGCRTTLSLRLEHRKRQLHVHMSRRASCSSTDSAAVDQSSLPTANGIRTSYSKCEYRCRFNFHLHTSRLVRPMQYLLSSVCRRNTLHWQWHYTGGLDPSDVSCMQCTNPDAVASSFTSANVPTRILAFRDESSCDLDCSLHYHLSNTVQCDEGDECTKESSVSSTQSLVNRRTRRAPPPRRSSRHAGLVAPTLPWTL